MEHGHIPRNVAASLVLPADLLEQKREVPVEVPRRQDAIHLYGVDLLNTKEVGCAACFSRALGHTLYEKVKCLRYGHMHPIFDFNFMSVSSYVQQIESQNSCQGLQPAARPGLRLSDCTRRCWHTLGSTRQCTWTGWTTPLATCCSISSRRSAPSLAWASRCLRRTCRRARVGTTSVSD